MPVCVCSSDPVENEEKYSAANEKVSSGFLSSTNCRKSARSALSSGCWRMYTLWSFTNSSCNVKGNLLETGTKRRKSQGKKQQGTCERSVCIYLPVQEFWVHFQVFLPIQRLLVKRRLRQVICKQTSVEKKCVIQVESARIPEVHTGGEKIGILYLLMEWPGASLLHLNWLETDWQDACKEKIVFHQYWSETWSDVCVPERIESFQCQDRLWNKKFLADRTTLTRLWCSRNATQWVTQRASGEFSADLLHLILRPALRGSVRSGIPERDSQPDVCNNCQRLQGFLALRGTRNKMQIWHHKHRYIPYTVTLWSWCQE